MRDALSSFARTDNGDNAHNVDPRERAYYERLAHSWWDRSGAFWPLHRLNELRTQWLLRNLCACFSRDPKASEPLKNLRMLDVGCGGGLLSEALARLGACVHGIDVVDKNVQAARIHARGQGLRVRYDTVDAGSLRDKGAHYDVVLNMEVLEHVPDPAALVRDCTGLLQGNGVLVLATLNRTFRSWLFAIIGAEYILGWLPRGTHRWRQFLTPGELEQYLAADNFRSIAHTGVRMNPLTRELSLSNSTAVNYMMLARRMRSADAEAHEVVDDAATKQFCEQKSE